MRSFEKIRKLNVCDKEMNEDVNEKSEGRSDEKIVHESKKPRVGVEDEAREELDKELGQESFKELGDEPKEESVEGPREKQEEELMEKPTKKLEEGLSKEVKQESSEVPAERSAELLFGPFSNFDERENIDPNKPFPHELYFKSHYSEDGYQSKYVQKSFHEGKRSVDAGAGEPSSFQVYQPLRQVGSPKSRLRPGLSVTDLHGEKDVPLLEKDENAPEYHECSGSSGKRRRSELDFENFQIDFDGGSDFKQHGHLGNSEKRRCIESEYKGPYAESAVPSSHENEKVSKQHERSGSSGKRRRRELENNITDDKETREDARNGKRRKTKWADDPTKLKILGPLHLPDFMSDVVTGSPFYLELLELEGKLIEINNRLKKPELQNVKPEGERSPSPEPEYNDKGIRMNTREARIRAKLVHDRHCIIANLIQKNPTFQPPPDYLPRKLSKKLYIPVKEYPWFNFFGLLVGHRGSTQRRMERESGAKISIRGRGITKTPRKSNASDNDDLHVYVEADSQSSLDAAVAMIEKLLIPVEWGTTRPNLAQLKKLSGSNEEHPVGTFGSSPSTHNIQSKLMNDGNLYVGYLPQSMDENQLGRMFATFGTLTKLKVVRDPMTGLSKGYGFVTYENAADAAGAAACMNGYEMNGHRLAVRFAGHSQTFRSPMATHPVYSTPPPSYRAFSNRTGCPGPTGSVSRIYHLDRNAEFAPFSGISSCFDYSPSNFGTFYGGPSRFVQLRGDPYFTPNPYPFARFACDSNSRVSVAKSLAGPYCHGSLYHSYFSHL